MNSKYTHRTDEGPVRSTGPEDAGSIASRPENNPRLDEPRVNAISFVLLSPAALLLATLFLGPVLYAVYLGFTNLQLIGVNAVNYRFTGLRNIIFMLNDMIFYKSLWLTVIFVIGSGAIATTLLGLVLALAIQKCSAPIRWITSAAAILAWTLPPTTIAFLWMATSAQSGLISILAGNQRLDLLYQHAMFVVSTANAWSLAGLAMTMFSAALRNIPEDLMEAAQLEGSTSVQSLRRITLPMLKPTIVTCALLMMLMTFGNFTLIYLMTGGGPNNETNILPVYTYQQGFKFHNLGYAALLGNIMVLLSAGLGAMFVWVTKARRPQ
ncbi:binding-protein-dependent transport systems inner membrane component [Agrobacterium sp. ATCC 31749]|uniref:carbohydrate ABC transporter permease n=1 Tax=unclassified Agrobacterium TaxID=2632611 RepID=UPI00020DC001|nr:MULTISPECIES: sugar ABC transporter permease [unclassified Agrobacterium]EGL65187.1 binding-protein-dependent transport systems inner membrane component [Agrobacterium sp. ATCC 31749]QKX00585.1 ABC transporter permease subunit [Agrobacterium sp. CGMCC 11546]